MTEEIEGEQGDEVAGSATEMAPATEDGRPPRSRRMRMLVVLAAVVIVAAGAGIAVAVTSSSSGGGNSPTTVVTALLAAANKSDVLGALAVLDPGERAAIEPSLDSIVADFRRLDVLSSSTDLNGISGLKFDFSGAKTSTDYLSPDLALVTFKGGRVTAAEDPAKLPLGSFIRQVAAKPLKAAKPQQNTSPLSSGREGVATVKVGGTWYVSLGYTIAGLDALRSSGKAALPPAHPVTAAGASSSTGAVSALLRAITGLNVRSMIAITPPDEMAALQAYAPLFLKKADSGTAKVSRSVSVSITHLGMTSRSQANGTLVQVTSFALTVNLDGIAASLSYSSGGCLTGEFATKHIHECPKSAAQIQQAMKLLPATLRPIVRRLESIHPQVGFVTVQENGRWYVSPTRTLLGDLDAYLAELKASDLTTVANNLPAIEKAARQLPQQLKQRGLGSTLS